MKALLVLLVVGLVTFGQLVIKHGVQRLGESGGGPGSVAAFIWAALTDPYVLSGLTAAAVAAVTWIVTLSKYQLSSVYPLLSMTFVLVPAASVYFFSERIGPYQVAGIGLIVLGILVFSKGG
jgi:drug/metabolite transporter (DMT)-like permease